MRQYGERAMDLSPTTTGKQIKAPVWRTVRASGDQRNAERN
jgi:hypothetical protein